mgnify:FL=1
MTFFIKSILVFLTVLQALFSWPSMSLGNSLNWSVDYFHTKVGVQEKYLTVTPSNQSVGPEAGRVSFIISSNTEWTVSDDSEWIIIL